MKARSRNQRRPRQRVHHDVDVKCGEPFPIQVSPTVITCSSNYSNINNVNRKHAIK